MKGFISGTIIAVSILKLNNLTLRNFMRKLLLFIALFYASQSSSFSQVKYGYKFGLESTSVSSTYSAIVSLKSGLGYHFGFFADIKAGDDFYFQPTVQFIRHVAKVEYKQSSATLVYPLINIPINMVFKFDSVQLGFGPQWSISTDNSETRFGLNGLVGYGVSERTSIQINYSFDLKKDYYDNKSEIGISLLSTFGKL